MAVQSRKYQFIRVTLHVLLTLIFLLKGAAPDKYKDRVEQKIHAEVNVKTDPTELTDAELQDIALRGRTGTIKAPVGSQSPN